MSKFFIRRPIFAIVISIIIVLLGTISLLSLPIAQYPQISPPTISLSASYTGANATIVNQTVAQVIEEQLNGLENMSYMSSTSSNDGSYSLSVVFDLSSDGDTDSVNVQNNANLAKNSLPSDVQTTGLTVRKSSGDMVLMANLYSPNGTYDQAFLKNYADIYLLDKIQRINGVGNVNTFGSSYAMRVWLNPDKLAERNLTVSDVISAIKEQNISAPAGTVGGQPAPEIQEKQYSAKVEGRLTTPEQFGNIILKSASNGQFVYLKDVAKIETGTQNASSNSKINGKNGIGFGVQLTNDANALDTISQVKQVLNEAKENFPPDLDYIIVMDNTSFINASISEVKDTFVESLLLVILVVFIFLQKWRTTLIPVLAVPVSIVGTFATFIFLDFTINTLTLFAMVLAIGLVVDDAIVVVEGVHAKLDQGYKSAKLASIDAMNELGGAIVSITLVMMSVFIPVSFMSGTAGTFYRQFGLTMAISIGLSALNALTLSPALCAMFLKPHEEGHEKKSTFVSRFHSSFNAAYDSLLNSYKKRVVFFIQKKWLSFGIVAGCIVLLVVLMNATPTGMVPNEDTGTIMGAVTLPPGTSQERTIEVMNKVDSLIAADPAVKSRTAVIGFSFIGGQGPSYGSFIIKLKDWEERSMMQSSDIVYGSLFMRAQKIVKDAQVLFFTPPMIPGYSASSDIELNMQDKTGGDLEKFFEVTKQYTAALTARPEIKSAQSTFNPNFPQYMIDIDAAACKKVGISPSDILATMQGYYGGLYASNFNRFGKMYRVMVQADPALRTNLESLKNIKVRNGNEMAPISQFVSIKKVYGPDIISRFRNLQAEENRERTEQSFLVSKDEIVENAYDLSINKYKKIEYVPVEYPPTSEILAELNELEMEINKGLKELEKML